MDIFSIIMAVNLLMWVGLSISWHVGIAQIASLKELRGEFIDLEEPFVSIVIPACNEAEVIEASINTIMKQDYKNFEVIVINDRSIDKTGEKLEQLKEQYPQLQVIHIKELPSGWIGKNHALYQGALKAKGVWLLFTDADLVYSADCLRVAVGYSEDKKLDHLTLLPEFTGKSLLTKAFLMYYFISAVWLFTPKRIKDPKAKEHTGIGAFNLIRRDTYLSIGTHQSLALRPDDDIKLGKLVKEKGFSQEFAFGIGLLSIEMYDSLVKTVKGFQKFLFAYMNYSVITVVFAPIMLFFLNIPPYVGVLYGGSVVRFLSGLVIFQVLLMYWHFTRHTSGRVWYTILHPFSVFLFVYMILNSALTTIFRGGIEWRGTKYSLDSLKNFKV